MRLTPADVHNVAFKKPSIGKRGYDEDEVDAFLDLVEAELSRLIEENNDLNQRLAERDSDATIPASAVGLGKTVAEPAPSASERQGAADHQPVRNEPAVAQPSAPAPAEPPAAPAPQAPQPVAQPAPVAADHHMHAARLLGLAEETAERLTTEAQAQADSTRNSANAESEKVLTDARSQSEKLLSDAKSRSEHMLTEAKNNSEQMVTKATEKAQSTTRDSQLKAEAIDREAQRKYTEVMSQLTTERTGLEKKIDDLRTYEREYRSRLKGWITEQLSQLDENVASGATEGNSK